MPAIGTLGKYEIRRELGRGAMGVVYEGYDPLIKRTVALKTLRADELAGEDAPALVARFRREAEAAGRLSHPNIVPIYEFAEDGGTWFIAMELCAGRELRDYFQANERFKPAEIVRIMSQLLDALDCAHRQGVVHRDIKPANLFLLPDGTLKVADFGVAHLDTSSMTEAGSVIGTPSYMSPEQILGAPVDGRSDLFSAGVILYQLLTGERPFAGSQSTTTMQKVLNEQPLPPSSLNVGISPVLDDVLRKALAKRPDERFQTAQAFKDALVAASRVATARNAAAAPSVSSDSTLVAGGATTVLAPRPMPAAPAYAAVPAAKTSRTVAYAIVAAAALVALAAGAWLVSQRSTDEARTAAVAVAPSAAVAIPASPIDREAPVVPAMPVAAPAIAPGMLVISAVGLVDPAGARYQGDRSALAVDLRADARRQLVEKVLVLLLDRASLDRHYDLLSDRLLSNSATFIETVMEESEPQLGRHGLASLTTHAVVNVKAIQKSLNQMSRNERIELIRATGDPTISVGIVVRDADRADTPAQPSPVAENVVKKRIGAFGFRTWSEHGADAGQGASFAVHGEARIRKLSTRLEASGLMITKYTLTSWTIKATDRATGEEVYFDTALPKGIGSWASEEEALTAIGTRIADAFSRDFFLAHVNVTGRKTVLVVTGMPDAASEALLGRELVGLPAVVTARPRLADRPPEFDLQLAGAGPAGDVVARDVLAPLNAKLGQACFRLGAISGDRVAVAFDPRCGEAQVLSRLETAPPAGLYGASPGRQKSVIKNPETLRKVAA